MLHAALRSIVCACNVEMDWHFVLLVPRPKRDYVDLVFIPFQFDMAMYYCSCLLRGKSLLSPCRREKTRGTTLTCQRDPPTQNINNNPYHTALGPEQHSGLNKFNKLPNDHPRAPEGPDKTSALISTDQPHNCNIDEAPQNSSSQNLTRKVKYWWDWTYTDGSLQKNEVGQDNGSGVYHPHLNVSHYVNQKGMGMTNTISRADLAAIAAAVIHGYSHIATDSLT